MKTRERGRPRDIRLRRSLARLGLLAAAALLPLAGHAAPGDDAAERSATVARTVFSILSYARWPGDPETVRLCVIGPTEYADELLRPDATSPGRKVAVQRLRADSERLATECDGVYAGALGNAQWRQVLARTAGRPVLSIGERPELCTSGGMFCLDPRTAGVSFEVNLDSVARSSVRIHPRVLQLARRKGGNTP